MGRNDKVKKHTKGFIKGTLIGAAIGSIAALLLAPKSGKETQADLKNKARRVVKDVDQKVSDLQVELDGRIDEFKVVARDLRGEAYAESQKLITRAELLKQDLQESAGRLGKAGKSAKDDALVDAKRLVGEGSAVMGELEKATKKIMRSARDKIKDQDERQGGDGDKE